MAKRLPRRGTTLVESLVAAGLVSLLVSLVAGGLWSWSRTQRRFEIRRWLRAALEDRLERCVTLPLHVRPGPGVYSSENLEGLSEDLKLVLEPKVGSNTFAFKLEVASRPLHYPDYFFGGKDKVEYLDFRVYRLEAELGGIQMSLGTFR